MIQEGAASPLACLGLIRLIEHLAETWAGDERKVSIFADCGTGTTAIGQFLPDWSLHVCRLSHLAVSHPSAMHASLTFALAPVQCQSIILPCASQPLQPTCLVII